MQPIQKNSPALGIGLALLAFVVVEKVFGLFADEQPGGDVDPAPDDTRPATLTASQALALADRIEVAVYGTGVVVTPYEDDADFCAALLVPRVSADVRLLMNAYGERGTLLNELTLSETVAAYLDPDILAEVRAQYAARGITQFF
jgi:hypothetical protein